MTSKINSIKNNVIKFQLDAAAYYASGASLVAQLVKNPPAIQETPVQFLGQEDPLEKGQGTAVFLGLPGSSDGKESACNAGDPSSIPGSGRSPRKENGNPLQHFCLECPWTEEPGKLYSMGSQRVGYNLVTKQQQQ